MKELEALKKRCNASREEIEDWFSHHCQELAAAQSLSVLESSPPRSAEPPAPSGFTAAKHYPSPERRAVLNTASNSVPSHTKQLPKPPAKDLLLNKLSDRIDCEPNNLEIQCKESVDSVIPTPIPVIAQLVKDPNFAQLLVWAKHTDPTWESRLGPLPNNEQRETYLSYLYKANLSLLSASDLQRGQFLFINMRRTVTK